MKLIVGLGNPGRQYQNTRHNVGHLFIDYLGSQGALPGAAKMLKTSSFMNDSGQDVARFMALYQAGLEDFLVVHDDMDLPLGEFKMQLGRGSAGHKGVQSVIDVLSAQGFWRLRFGIGRPVDDTPSEEYVLCDFYKEEKPKLEAAFEEALPQVRSWISKQVL